MFFIFFANEKSSRFFTHFSLSSKITQFFFFYYCYSWFFLFIIFFIYIIYFYTIDNVLLYMWPDFFLLFLHENKNKRVFRKKKSNFFYTKIEKLLVMKKIWSRFLRKNFPYLLWRSLCQIFEKSLLTKLLGDWTRRYNYNEEYFYWFSTRV